MPSFPEIGHLGLRRGDERAGLGSEHGVVGARRSPDVIMGKQLPVGEGRDFDEVSDRRDPAYGESRHVAHHPRLGAGQRFARQAGGLDLIEPHRSRQEEKIEPAAFLAAEQGQHVGMTHLLHAARREYQKIGRLIDDRLFRT